jgi:hypothetical protein
MTTRHTPLKNKDTHLITANQHFEFITLFNWPNKIQGSKVTL